MEFSCVTFGCATSAVDAATEARPQGALRRLVRGRTSFIVAHRLSAIVSADQIRALDHGHVVERGTHAELLRGQGHCYQLYRGFAAAGLPAEANAR